ncbi:MAG: hypothetical protein EZS28_051020 [Streblomastix strix]|uniref:Uncharacterized protein n=1 Tax=Streblomastix strix TaxID=222440 RepID=A0A5J4T648_9EUKA|nr:MAG: hypothetical protein EZS28_051020 [Streblomastix strix]
MLPREWYDTCATGLDQESEEASARGCGRLLLDEIGQSRHNGGASVAGDLTDERENYKVEIDGIMVIEAAMEDMYMGNGMMLMNELLSTIHALRIIAGDAQIQRQVAIALKDATEVLKTGGGATLLYGSESKKNVKEVLNIQN